MDTSSHGSDFHRSGAIMQERGCAFRLESEVLDFLIAGNGDIECKP